MIEVLRRTPKDIDPCSCHWPHMTEPFPLTSLIQRDYRTGVTIGKLPDLPVNNLRPLTEPAAFAKDPCSCETSGQAGVEQDPPNPCASKEL